MRAQGPTGGLKPSGSIKIVFDKNMKLISDNLKYYWGRVRDFCVYKILHADDPPHRLALGIAIGLFVTFLPLIGLQMVLSVFLSWLLRANKLVGVPLVWISNPLTIIPIYYPCYRFGCSLMGVPVVGDAWTQMQTDWQLMLADPGTTWGMKVQFWWGNLMQFVGPLSLGCIIVATVAGVFSYYVSLFAIRAYRIRRFGQLMPPVHSIEAVEPPAPAKNGGSEVPAETADENAA